MRLSCNLVIDWSNLNRDRILFRLRCGKVLPELGYDLGLLRIADQVGMFVGDVG